MLLQHSIPIVLHQLKQAGGIIPNNDNGTMCQNFVMCLGLIPCGHGLHCEAYFGFIFATSSLQLT